MKLDEAYDVVTDCRRKMPTLKALATSMLNCVDELDFDYYGIFVGLETMFKEFHEQLMEVEGAIGANLDEAEQKKKTEDALEKDSLYKFHNLLSEELGKAQEKIGYLKEQIRQHEGKERTDLKVVDGE